MHFVQVLSSQEVAALQPIEFIGEDGAQHFIVPRKRKQEVSNRMLILLHGWAFHARRSLLLGPINDLIISSAASDLRPRGYRLQ